VAMGQGSASCTSCEEKCCADGDSNEERNPSVLVHQVPGFTEMPETQDNTGTLPDFSPTASSLATPADDCVQTVMYKDGSSYTGYLVDGRRDGGGKWRAVNGAYEYEGQWRADLPTGEGRQTWSDGRIYQGQFDEGIFHGMGKMVWQTPQGTLSYEGRYEKDVKHGHGKFMWPDGRGYDGQWVQGKRAGSGVYINSRGERKDGIWKNDKFDRWVAVPEDSGRKCGVDDDGSETEPR